MNILDKTATIGDLLVWNIGLAGFLLNISVCPIMPSIVGRFDKMFMALGGKLPFVTELMIAHCGKIYAITTIVVTAMIYLGIFVAKKNEYRIILVVGANWILGTAIGLGILGIFYPILELQSAVRGGG